jgi:hypothetical protein
LELSVTDLGFSLKFGLCTIGVETSGFVTTMLLVNAPNVLYLSWLFTCLLSSRIVYRQVTEHLLNKEQGRASEEAVVA